MRPFENGDGFNFFVSGLKVDHEKLAGRREELIKCFYTVTGLTDVEFGDLIWSGLWKCVSPFTFT